MDPHVRAKLFSPSLPSAQKTTNNQQSLRVFVNVSFEVPVLIIELRGDESNEEQGLVDLSFRDFAFNYEKCHKFVTNVQVSLRSIFMEDLLQPEGSR